MSLIVKRAHLPLRTEAAASSEGIRTELSAVPPVGAHTHTHTYISIVLYLSVTSFFHFSS